MGLAPIVIVDYGMGNLGSVQNALQGLGSHCAVSSDPRMLRQARGIVLPGVGAFRAAIGNLRERGLEDVLGEEVLIKEKPFLGICLGMQLLARDSVELGYTTGLGWIEAHVQKLDTPPGYRIPHVGWNQVEHRDGGRLFQGVSQNAHFFFDHSFHMKCDPGITSATMHYGGQWVAGIHKKNILAVQFHPEKSQRNGLKLLRNFLNFVNNGH